MENKNCELLFEYLRSILYDREIQKLDLEKLDEPYRKLGRGLQVLERTVEEMLDYSKDLSVGNLSCQVPSRDNFLCANLKNLHASLNHLTWQAKQVASGDYSQRVSYLGEFSESFNSMTRQLQERENLLKKEVEQEKEKAVAMEHDNEIFVDQLAEKAYHDPLTGIANRLFFSEFMEKLLTEKASFTFCYMDLDHLKLVNDHYGHLAGDKYLKDFVENVKANIRDDDFFARVGGDEFCVIFVGCSQEMGLWKMEKIQKRMSETSGSDFTKSFSYGVVEYDGHEAGLTLEEILKSADESMYRVKRARKVGRS